MKKWIKILITLAVVGGAAFGLVWWKAQATAKVEPREAPLVVRRGDLAVKVAATGTVEPEFTVEVKSKASGAVEQVAVVDGDLVKKGQLLVGIDPILERRKVTQAEAELRVAQAQAGAIAHKRDYAIAQLKRDEALLKKGLVAAEAVETLRKEVAVLTSDARMQAAQLVRAREQLSEAKDRLSETTIRSPIDGTVLERTVQPGQIVASGTSSVNGGTTLLKIADLSRLFVRVKADEADVAKLKAGMPVRVTADALAGKVFGGKVLRVAPQGRVESNVTVFEVVVEVDAEGKKLLRPMMSANVEILVAEKKGVVLVPARAVRQREGRAIVLAAEGPRQVVTGLTDNKDIEIVAGLQAGEEIKMPAAQGAQRPAGQPPRGMGGGAGGQMRRMVGGGR